MKRLVWLLVAALVAVGVYDIVRTAPQNYTPQMLDGRTSLLSHYLDSLLRACADLVFVQSAGNEGNKEWRYISFPGDVRDVITVGYGVPLTERILKLLHR